MLFYRIHFLGLTALLLLPPAILAQDTPAQRLPVPDATSQKNAEKMIRDIFKDEYAKKAPADQQALAQKLLQQGRDTKDDPAARYVLLQEAMEIAAKYGDVETALGAADEMGKLYEVDALALKIQVFTTSTGAAKTPEAAISLVEACLQAADEAVTADKFKEAKILTGKAEAAAKVSKDVALYKRVQKRADEIEDLEREQKKAKDAQKVLESNPNESDALLVLGRYALLKGDLEKALPMLSRGSDTVLKVAAEKDLAAPTEAEGQADVGDAWWEAAEKEKDAIVKLAIRRRAKVNYEKAVAGLSGIAKTKVEKRLGEMAYLLLRGDDKRIREKLESIKGFLKTAKNPTELRAAIEELVALGEEAIVADAYDLAVRAMDHAEKIAKELKDPALTNSMQTKVYRAKSLQQEWSRVRGSMKILEEKPDEGDANLAVGKFLCICKGDWKSGIQRLLKGSDAQLRGIAEADAGAGTAADAIVEVAERWRAYSEKNPKFRDRAIHWYKRAWPDLRGIEKEKVRRRAAEMQAVAGARESEPLRRIPNWTFSAESGVSLKYAVTGKTSARIVNSKGSAYYVMMDRQPIVPGKGFVVTAFVLSDQTSGGGSVNIYWYDKDNNKLSEFGKKVRIPDDFPFWQKLEMEGTVPPDAALLAFDITIFSAKGAIWIDDVSIKVEGAEIVKNGSFEEK